MRKTHKIACRQLWKILPGITLCVIACSCTVRPELTRRHAHLVGITTDATTTHALVSAFTITPPPRSPSVRDLPLSRLSDRGQAAVAKAIGTQGPKGDPLLRGLVEQKRSSGTSRIDRTSFTRRLIFTVAKTTEVTNPADRLSRLAIWIGNLEGAEFVSWNRFETRYESVDLGKIKLGQSVETKAALSIGPQVGATTPVSGSLGYTGKRVMDEEISLRQRYVALSGLLTPNSAKLFQEGVVGIDLAGNSAIDFALKLTDTNDDHRVFRFKKFENIDGTVIAPDKLSFEILPIIIPGDSTQPVACELGGTYELRHVLKGGRTVNEGDDRIILNRGTLGMLGYSNSVVFVHKDELRRLQAIFMIAEHSDPGSYLHLKGGPLAQRTELLFESYDAATDFLNWMRRDNRNRKVRTWPLVYGDGTDPFSGVSGALDHFGVYLLY